MHRHGFRFIFLSCPLLPSFNAHTLISLAFIDSICYEDTSSPAYQSMTPLSRLGYLMRRQRLPLAKYSHATESVCIYECLFPPF